MDVNAQDSGRDTALMKTTGGRSTDTGRTDLTSDAKILVVINSGI